MLLCAYWNLPASHNLSNLSEPDGWAGTSLRPSLGQKEQRGRRWISKWQQLRRQRKLKHGDRVGQRCDESRTARARDLPADLAVALTKLGDEKTAILIRGMTRTLWLAVNPKDRRRGASQIQVPREPTDRT